MFGRTSTSKRVIAVADIGSGSAAVALVALDSSGNAVAIASNRVVLPFEKRADDATAKAIIAALSEAGEKTLAAYAASSSKDLPIERAYAVIRAPWTQSKTERAYSAAGEALRITDSMIRELAQQAVGSDTELDHDNLIESSIVRVELNGYPTGSPVGKSAQTISVSVLLSACDGSFKRGIEEVLGRLFPDARPILRSGARALAAAVGNHAGVTGRDYVILDIEGEASTLIVVRDRLSSEHLLIPEGVRSILTRVSDKGLPEETLSLLRMMERDEGADDASGNLSASVARVETDLARVYGDYLTKMAAVSRLPANLILITHPDLTPWLTAFFSRIDFSQCTATAQPFNVRGLTKEDFGTITTIEHAAPLDTGLCIAVALVNTEERP